MQASFIDCPSCGSSFVHASGVHEPQSEFTDPLAALTRSEGLSDLQDRVRSLDALISRLNQERADALRRINTIRDKTSHLPSEILSNIFQFVCPPIDFRHHLPLRTRTWGEACPSFRRDTHYPEEVRHFKLARVSCRWRQIILSTPQLWTTISLGVWKALMRSHISLLNLYCQCAGNLGISIELDFRFLAIRWLQEEDIHEMKADIALLEPIFEAVFTRIAPTIRHLTLILPPLEVLVNIGKDFSSCNSLTIYGVVISSWQEDPLANVAKLPHLQHVFLHEISFPIILPWLSITILDLDAMPMSLAFDVLTKCLNLVKFRNPGSAYRLRPDQSNAEQIEHENLESMICGDDVDLYRHFQFTRLQTLHWGNIIGNGEYDLRIQIFSNLPSTLKSLTFGEIYQTRRDHLQDLLLCVPQLLELRLFRCDEDANQSLIQSIGRPSRSEASTVDGPIILPNLRRLSILAHEMVDSQMVVDMLEALSTMGTGEEGFHLELSGIEWHEAASRRLQVLVSSGFNIEITTDAKIPERDSPVYPWW